MAPKPKARPATADDLQWLDELQAHFPADKPGRPWVQYLHKEPGPGFEVPLRNLPPAVAAALASEVTLLGTDTAYETVRATVQHSQGLEPAWISGVLHVALVAHAPTTYRVGKDWVPTYVAGAHSRDHYLVVCRELWEAGWHDFVVLTLRSSACGDFNAVKKGLHRLRATISVKVAHRAGEADTAAQTVVPPLVPTYFIWIPLLTGEPQKVEDGQRVPILSRLPAQDAPLEEVRALRLAPEVRDFIKANLAEAAAWAGRSPAADNLLGEEAGEPEVGGRNPNLNVRVVLQRADIPEEMQGFCGKTFCEILADPAGRDFITWLAASHKPRHAGETKLQGIAASLCAAAEK